MVLGGYTIHLFDGHTIWTPSQKVYAIAVCEGCPIGMASLGRLEGHVWISDLLIPEKWRRKGIATAIVRRLESEAIVKGETVCAVGIDERNEPSISLFAKLGYQEYARGPHEDVVVAWLSKELKLEQKCA